MKQIRTIEKILGYKPYTEQQVHFLKMANLYNGTGTADINFDSLIMEVFNKLVEAKIYDSSKAEQLRRDIEQLVIRHDLDTASKIGFRRSNRRLALGIYRLLHNFPMLYRVGCAYLVGRAVSSNIARNNYNLIK